MALFRLCLEASGGQQQETNDELRWLLKADRREGECRTLDIFRGALEKFEM
jgi:hypothetical protein